MIGLVLVTHGRLAVEFRAALEHVVGPQGQIEAVTIGPDDDVEQRRKDIIEAVKRVDTGDGVVILTDMFGGTPSNLAISVMGRPRSRCWPASTCRCWSSSPASATRCPLERGGRSGPGRRPQIHHRRQPRACRKMSGAETSTAICRTPRTDRRHRPSLNIVNKKGLHARAAAKFVQSVGGFDAE